MAGGNQTLKSRGRIAGRIARSHRWTGRRRLEDGGTTKQLIQKDQDEILPMPYGQAGYAKGGERAMKTEADTLDAILATYLGSSPYIQPTCPNIPKESLP